MCQLLRSVIAQPIGTLSHYHIGTLAYWHIIILAHYQNGNSSGNANTITTPIII